MAVTTETVTQHLGSEPDKFSPPKILSVNLKKKLNDPSTSFETSSQKNGVEINKCPDPIKLAENSQKKLSERLDHEIPSRVDLNTVNPAEDDQDVIEMAPERHRDKGGQKQSSYLLQPFLKPVAQHIEGNATENPILKALFGGNNSINNNNKQVLNWIAGDRPTTNNCHPFKKTEFSRDITNDGLPVHVPKSLSKHKERPKHSSAQARVETTPKSVATTPVLKEIDMPKAVNVVASSPATTNVPKRAKSPAKVHADKENDNQSIQDSPRRTLSKLQTRRKMSSQSSLKGRLIYVNSERLMQLRTMVDNAIKNHKVYSMTGCYTSVRNALRQRGWIEKIDSDIKGKRKQNRFDEIGIYDAAFQFVQKFPTLAAMRYSIQSHSGFSHNDQINYSGQGEAEIMNRMLRNINEDLCWLSRPYPYYCWKDISKFDMVNRLPRAYFSNKIGLCNSLQHIQWFFEPGICSTQYPRTYNMSQKDEYEAFRDDFRMTACISLLKWLTINYRVGGERAVRSTDGKVDSAVIDFALKRCTDFVRYKDHEDIDLPEGPVIWEYQWDHFILQYYKIINDGCILRETKNDPSIQVLVTSSLSMLNLIKSYWPQINIDGYQNYWVVKPGGRCCGNGIVIKNNLEQILMLVNPSVTRETRYVVQKYIERPLLIYNTKFDIRQWFLVTNVYPLTVWMYRESYLRFCSQPFSLKSTHESIHLCNNAVQRRYKNSKRDRGLPDENMWDCYTFQTYLKSVGHPDAWEKHIYPGMKEGFIGALLASQDTMERRKNCFELYGADFMISDTLSDGPWLIEINSNPAMDSSTSVTARLCPQVLEDIVKVVIDRRDDKNASTGAFEMVYKQHCPPVPPYLGMSLSIKGQKLNRTLSGEAKTSAKKSKNPNSSGKFLQTDSEESQSEDPSDAKSLDNIYKIQKIDPYLFKRIGPIKQSKKEVNSAADEKVLRTKFAIQIVDSQSDESANETASLKDSTEVLKEKLNEFCAQDILIMSEVSSHYASETLPGQTVQYSQIFDQRLARGESMTSVPNVPSTSESLEVASNRERNLWSFFSFLKSSKSIDDETRAIAGSTNSDNSSHFSDAQDEVRCDAEPEEKDPPFERHLEKVLEENEEDLNGGLNLSDSMHSMCEIDAFEMDELYNEREEEGFGYEVELIPNAAQIAIQEIDTDVCVKRVDVCADEKLGNIVFIRRTGQEGNWITERCHLSPGSSVSKLLDQESHFEEICGKEKDFRTRKSQLKKPQLKKPEPREIDASPYLEKTVKISINHVTKRRKHRTITDWVQRNIDSFKGKPQENAKRFIKAGNAPEKVSQLVVQRLNRGEKQPKDLLQKMRETDTKKFIEQLISNERLIEKYGLKREKEEDSESVLRRRIEELSERIGKPQTKGTIEFATFRRNTGNELVAEMEKNLAKSDSSGTDQDGSVGQTAQNSKQLNKSKDTVLRDELLRGVPLCGAEKDRNPSVESIVTDWKSKIESTKRTCFEILSSLREFNDSNSKVRLQQVLTKGDEIDNRLRDALRAYRTKKGSGGRIKFLRESREECPVPKSWPRGRVVSVRYGERKKKCSPFRSPKTVPILAISAENGAVQTFPKIQQWAVPVSDAGGGDPFPKPAQGKFYDK